MATDYYETLGVPRTASKEEIKKAYKNLAKKYHPDISKEANAEQKFKEINEAASVLTDDKKKSQYDQYGSTQQGFESGGDSDFGGFNFGFEDLFGNIFGQSRRRQGPRRGEDLQMEISITLDDVLNGAKKHIVVPRMKTCSSCNGSGAQSSSDKQTCSTCHGSGQERRTTKTPFGLFQQTVTCRACGGQGEIIKEPCELCEGEGRMHEQDSITVDIPAGITDGARLRVAGKGHAGERGAHSGDLYLFISVDEHETFERDDTTVIVTVPISFTTAAMGGEIEVPTLEGKATLKIASGTQSHTIVRMRGKGLPSLHSSSRGDQHVRVVVEVPQKLSSKQKKILEEFEKASEKKTLKQRIFGN